MITFRANYFLIAVPLFATEVIIALFIHDTIVRPYVGDFLVVILIYCLVKSFLTWPVMFTAWSVLLFAYFIETLQYFNFLYHLGLGSSQIVNTILGNSFAWLDILAYTLGTLFAVGIERLRLSPKGRLLERTSTLFI